MLSGGGRYSDSRYSDNRYSDISIWVMQWVRVRVRIRVRYRVRARVRVKITVRVRVCVRNCRNRECRNRECQNRNLYPVLSTVLTMNAIHQCIYSQVRLIELNQSELDIGVKEHCKKKETNKHPVLMCARMLAVLSQRNLPHDTIQNKKQEK